MRTAALLALAACSYPGKQFVGGDGGSSDGGQDGPIAHPGDYVWIRSMSSLSTYGIADGAAGVVVTADLSGPADIGGNELTPIGSNDIVIAGFTDDGKTLTYTTQWGYAGEQEYAFMRNVDSNGAPLIYGITSGPTYDVGLGPTTNKGGYSGFVGRYGPNKPNWVSIIDGASDDQFSMITTAAGDKIYGLGWFDGTTTFNGTNYTSLGSDDIILARFDSFTGAVDLVKQYGGAGEDDPDGSAPLPNGGLVMSGYFGATINFGGTTSTLTSDGSNDVYVVELDDTGAGIWAKSFGGVGSDRFGIVAVDPAGDVYLAGTYTGTVQFGTQSFTAVGVADIFLLKLNGSDGSVVWADTLGSAGDDRAMAIAVDAHGRVVVTGWVTGIAGVPTLGGADAFIAEYAASDGSQTWMKVVSTAGDDRGWNLGYGVSGDIFWACDLGGSYDFGQEVLGPAGPASVIARVAP